LKVQQYISLQFDYYQFNYIFNHYLLYILKNNQIDILKHIWLKFDYYEFNYISNHYLLYILKNN